MLYLLVLLVATQCKNNNSKFPTDLEKTKREIQPILDSATTTIAQERFFLDSLESQIVIAYRPETESFLIHLVNQNPDNKRLHVLLGMIYTKKNVFDSANLEFNKAMSKYEYPYALDKRAKMHLQQGNLTAATFDYHKAFLINSDYAKELAECYSKRNMRDSATKYFSIYKNLYRE